ncbi:MAG: DNA adenine methylase [Candidatus Hydrogenedentota bacterium]
MPDLPKQQELITGNPIGRQGREMPYPILKWAGGKGRLLPELVERVDHAGEFGRYHEPFLGGGALFFELYRSGRLPAGGARLSDANPNLMAVYEGVRDEVEAVIERLKAHGEAHGKEHYYAVREHIPQDLPGQAARIIYLNRTCYNGLYRENKGGKFNTPMGDYKNPVILDADNLREAAKALQQAEIATASFEEVLNHAAPGDFVYFDPPYVPLSSSANFTSYAKNGFGEKEQRLLAETMTELDARGVKVLLSNSMTPLIKELYQRFTVDTVHAPRLVNSKAGGRGNVAEALVRNFGS